MSRWRWKVSAILTIVFMLATSVAMAQSEVPSVGNTSTVSNTPAVGTTQAVENYLIGVDDMVQVSVWRNPDLGITVPVRPDGRISVPLVGDVLAGGRTPEQVADDIQAKLAAFVRDPQVAVILTDLRSHEYLSRVRVTGAVRQPVSVPYRQGMTVLDAVLAAGGLTEFAAANRAELFRKTNGESVRIPVELDNILKRGDLRSNHDVAPGDIITIPERLF